MLNARSSAPMTPVTEQLGLDRGERSGGPLEPRRIAHDADVVPHRIEQPFPQLVQVARACVNGCSARDISAVQHILVRLPHGPDWRAIQRGITSPAMPPKTVELATPLPPSRLAPCMPLASSPATKRPGHSRRGIGAGK